MTPRAGLNLSSRGVERTYDRTRCLWLARGEKSLWMALGSMLPPFPCFHRPGPFALTAWDGEGARLRSVAFVFPESPETLGRPLSFRSVTGSKGGPKTRGPASFRYESLSSSKLRTSVWLLLRLKPFLYDLYGSPAAFLRRKSDKPATSPIESPFLLLPLFLYPRSRTFKDEYL